MQAIVKILLFSLMYGITMLNVNPKNFSFKPLQQEDLPLLYQWFKEPHVSTWWPVPEEGEDFFNFFLLRIRSKDTFPFMVLLNQQPIGYIQYYKIDFEKHTWMPKLPLDTLGIDQFIGDPVHIGKGYGTLFIKEFIKFMVDKTQNINLTVIVDPDPTNKAAIRCYEKVGFVAMGEFKAPYGPALLMRYSAS